MASSKPAHYGVNRDGMDVESGLLDDGQGPKFVSSVDIGLRMAFIRKVYMVLTCQLLLSCIFAAVAILHQPTNLFIRETPGLLFAFMMMSFILICALSVVRHVYPWNITLLLMFTICESYLVASVVIFYKATSVLQAFMITVGIFCALTLYTFQSKRDFTVMGTGLFVGLLGVLFASVIGIFLPGVTIFQTVLAAAIAILFSLYVVYDTHMLIYVHSVDEWVLVSVNLYLDILNIFLSILRLTGGRSE